MSKLPSPHFRNLNIFSFLPSILSLENKLFIKDILLEDNDNNDTHVERSSTTIM
jgi:hypothetical protein